MAPDKAAPVHGLTIGTVEAIDAAANTIRVANVTYHLEAPGLLSGLEIGQFVTVSWDQTGDSRATRNARGIVSATRLAVRPLLTARGQDEQPAMVKSGNVVHRGSERPSGL